MKIVELVRSRKHDAMELEDEHEQGIVYIVHESCNHG